jgi:tetratricopeptide (TPR) repeat protein
MHRLSAVQQRAPSNGAFYGPSKSWRDLALSEGKASAIGGVQLDAEQVLPAVRSTGFPRRGKVGGLILVAALSVGIRALAHAQASAPVRQEISETAALLIQANRLDDAERVLALALQQNPNDNEAIFLNGLIAVTEERYHAAIDAFDAVVALGQNSEVEDS